MSHEVLPQSPSEAELRQQAMYDDLRMQSTVTPVANGHEFDILLDDTHSYSSITNKSVQVDQDLRAVIKAGDELFGVVEAKDTEHERTRYLLTRFDPRTTDHRRGLIVGAIGEEPMPVGRQLLHDLGAGDNANPRMSRKDHFSVKIVDGKLFVAAGTNTTNETEVLTRKEAVALSQPEVVAVGGLRKISEKIRARRSGSVQTEYADTWNPQDDFKSWSASSESVKDYLYVEDHPHTPEWGYTVSARVRNPDLTYKGRPVIHRDSPIDGGVYVNFGAKGPLAEAIFVDFSSRTVYSELLGRVIDQVTDHGGQTTGQSIADATYDVIRGAMKYSKHGVNELMKRVSGLTQPELGYTVSLASFLNAGIGVCRHQAVASALMIEQLIEQGYTRGKVSVDSNVNWNATGDEIIGGHAWTRFEDDNGEVYIVDVAQGYHGKLSDANTRDRWNYARPGDKANKVQQLSEPALRVA